MSTASAPLEIGRVALTVNDLAAVREFYERALGLDQLGGDGDRALLGAGDRVWGIDHGLCFHAESKLRTVIWDFAGQAICPPTESRNAHREHRQIVKRLRPLGCGSLELGRLFRRRDEVRRLGHGDL